jgi:hypothetical protein
MSTPAVVERSTRCEKYQAPRVILSLRQGRAVRVAGVVDHVDGNTRNNEPENLREVTRTQNQMNRCDNREVAAPAGEVDPW